MYPHFQREETPHFAQPTPYTVPATDPRIPASVRAGVQAASSPNPRRRNHGRPARPLFGNIYIYDSWDHYWEGHLKRVNGNLGTVSTQSDSWYAVYGVTDRPAEPYCQTCLAARLCRRLRRLSDYLL